MIDKLRVSNNSDLTQSVGFYRVFRFCSCEPRRVSNNSDLTQSVGEGVVTVSRRLAHVSNNSDLTQSVGQNQLL